MLIDHAGEELRELAKLRVFHEKVLKELKEANDKIKEYEDVIHYSKIENCCKVESLRTAETGTVQVELWLRREANDKFNLDEYIDFAHSHALKHSISEKTLVRDKHTVSQEDDCICITF